MIKYLLIIFSVNLSIAQEFEGIIRYGTKFEVTDENFNLKKKFRNQKESDSAIVAYTRKGSFLKYNYEPKVIDMYDSKTKLIYTIDKNDKYLVTTNPNDQSGSRKTEPIVVKSDSIITVNKINCKMIQFDYGYYKMTIYYNDDEKYKGMGKLFFYKSLLDSNIRESIISDFLIVKCIQEFDSVKSIVTLQELKSMELDSKIFEIPEFKKSRKYKYSEQDKFQVFKIIDKGYEFPNLTIG